MASMGLPGLNNFVGEILILVGAFKVRPVIGILSFAGLVVTVIYILRMVQDAIFGESRQEQAIADITCREGFILVMLAIPIVFIGLNPGPALRLLEPPVQRLLAQVSFLAMGR
jgi:NADH-quinone oxidoreductase subunit M